MRFLVIANPKHPVPPELAIALSDAMIGWVNGLKQGGKAESIWGSAGVAGGGCVLDVGSADELDGIMAAFPFGPFSEIQVIALVDVIESLNRFKKVAEAMVALAGKR